MWYVVHLLFAQDPEDGSCTVLCETSQVLFDAASAEAAYARGESWAREHEQDSDFRFVGIEHIQSIVEELGDGCEVGGRFFEDDDVWQRQSELIPTMDEIPAIMFERNKDRPIGELMTDEQKRLAQRLFKSDS